MNPSEGDKTIPAQWPRNYAFRVKDTIAMGSLLAFILVPGLFSLYAVGRAFGISVDGPAREQISGTRQWEYLTVTAFAWTVSGFAGKYLWLLAMCRLLDRLSVGPLVSCGIPRRISHLDRKLILRLYRHTGPALEERLRPDKSADYAIIGLAVAFGAGAILFVFVAYSHLAAHEERFWRGGIAFGVLAAVFGIGGFLARRGRL